MTSLLVHEARRVEVERANGRGCLTRSVKLARLVRYCSSSAESVTIACRPHRCARIRGGAHGQLPGGAGAPGKGKVQKCRKKGLNPYLPSDFCSLIFAFQYFSFSAFSLFVRGEEGETKGVTVATAFSEK
jgi:hypothetical protein